MTGDVTPTQIELFVEKSKKGDDESFGKLFHLFFDKIFRYISFRVEEGEVEDLVSDVFLKVVEKLHTYHPHPKAGFNSWIFRIAHNTVVDFYRKKKELLGIDTEDEDGFFLQIPDESPTPDQTADLNLSMERLNQILKRLPALQRDILQLKYLEEMTNSEIAVITGKSEGNIRVIQLRALREIRKNWDD